MYLHSILCSDLDRRQRRKIELSADDLGIQKKRQGKTLERVPDHWCGFVTYVYDLECDPVSVCVKTEM